MPAARSSRNQRQTPATVVMSVAGGATRAWRRINTVCRPAFAISVCCHARSSAAHQGYDRETYGARRLSLPKLQSRRPYSCPSGRGPLPKWRRTFESRRSCRCQRRLRPKVHAAIMADEAMLASQRHAVDGHSLRHRSWEKRNTRMSSIWESDLCIQCGMALAVRIRSPSAIL